jgi:hypothetical protein
MCENQSDPPKVIACRNDTTEVEAVAGRHAVGGCPGKFANVSATPGARHSSSVASGTSANTSPGTVPL